ncbi:C40 family peptidase [Ruminiclostridium cellulolyticum]|uniref:NLP/P60 protein n=1 Tax=Ruminiclostridium cellulolyticum (strain ATCC 35319 / DSM 5812 / JCM 6584 / H10) TaxID=394503 RepID=B8I3G1_RUMCH|nr:C40 family peptidase [Ruminiclostridium cellulolyticum]ACL76304.1 NLP/P60 protein [Ruminiclostridium cellulolyticum H10]
MTGKITKVLVGCIFAFSLVLVCSAVMAASQAAQIQGTGVNVRKGPNTSASIITKLSNKRVSVLDKSSGWYKISFDGKTGWVSDDYIKVLATKGSINANGVNFREGADTSSKIISSLKKGTSIQILDTLTEWHKIKVGSKVGYVSKKFVSSAANSTKTSRSTEAATFVSEEDNSLVGRVIAYSKKFIGVKYVYGGKSPSGFDCSGFVGYVFKNFGISLNSSSSSMYSNGTKVSKTALRPGDLLFFDASSRKSAGAIDHVGIYLGNNQFIHASTSKGKVLIQSLSEYQGTYIGAKRVI